MMRTYMQCDYCKREMQKGERLFELTRPKDAEGFYVEIKHCEITCTNIRQFFDDMERGTQMLEDVNPDRCLRMEVRLVNTL